MPKVAKATKKGASAQVVFVGSTITQEQLLEYADQLEEMERLKKLLNPVEKFVKQFNLKVMELVTGMKTEEEYKALDLDAVDVIMQKRLAEKSFKVEPGVIDFSLDYSSPPKRNVSWKDQFVALKGEAEAVKVQNDTPETYCYKVVPVQAEQQVPTETVTVTEVGQKVAA